MDAKNQAVLEDALQACGIDLAFHQLKAFMDFKDFVAKELERRKEHPAWAQPLSINLLMSDNEMKRLQSDCRPLIDIHEEALEAESMKLRGEGPSIWERMGEPGGCVGPGCRCEDDVALSVQHDEFKRAVDMA